MGYDSYTQINSLEETSFVAGTEYTFNFSVYAEDGTTPVSMNAATIVWMMSPLGSHSYIVKKTVGSGVTITGSNTFKVVLDGASTINLEQGVYIHQAVITDYTGSTYRPGQGRIVLAPAIQ